MRIEYTREIEVGMGREEKKEDALRPLYPSGNKCCKLCAYNMDCMGTYNSLYSLFEQ
jgi:hypothetical protein